MAYGGTVTVPRLPPARSPLIGRERESAMLRGYLQRPDTSLLTLTGTAGSGKTRLALDAAIKSQNEFADGAFFVDLAPVLEPELVSATIAQSIRLREEPGRTFEESLFDFLQDRDVLLVLDNFEHLLPGAPQVGALLNNSPGLKVLVTSREALRLRDEQEFPVSPLLLPDPQRLLPPGELAQIAAIELFVRRTSP